MVLEAIHQAMLDEIDDSYQKSPGFPAYDFTRAFALAALSLAGDVEAAESRLDPDLLEGDALDLYVYQHAGIVRRQAGYAEAHMQAYGTGTISAGDVFATESGLRFYALEDHSDLGSTFPVRAEEPGSAWNVPEHTVTVMPVQLPGISLVYNVGPAAGGADPESDEDLRQRFYYVMRHPANGGNVYAYEQWALDVDGVGRAMVFPTPDGPNTVDVCVVDAAGDPADEDLIAAVQAAIDPNHNGDGMGEAPIGAVCTVMAPDEVSVVTEATLTLEAGADQDIVNANVVTSIMAVIRRTALEGGPLRYALVADALMVEGVADYADLTLNGEARSVTMGAREIPVSGGVSITYESP